MKNEIKKRIAVPKEFLQRLNAIVPEKYLDAVLQGFAKKIATTFRVNTLRASEEVVLNDLKSCSLPLQKVTELDAYLIPQVDTNELEQSQSYQNGWIYVQSLSSQIPALILSSQPGDKVLDMAAAPGGKTSQMAALMQNQGEIIALEPDRVRYQRLVFNLERQGVKIAQALKVSGQKLSPKYKNQFDKVLLDAPCSSEGTFDFGNPETYKHWSLSFVRQKSRIQKQLLEVARSMVKSGGEILYSTCSLSPEENEEVIHWALTEFSDLKIQKITQKYSFLKPALRFWQGYEFDPKMRWAKRIYPSELMEGFFMCLLRKGS